MTESKKELRARCETLEHDIARYRKALDEAYKKIARMQAPAAPDGRSLFARKWDWLADHANAILKGGA